MQDVAEIKARSDQFSKQIITAAIEVHRVLGPGLLESAYESCLCHEFDLQKIPYKEQVPLPVEYKGLKLDCAYRMDVCLWEVW